MPDSLFDDVSLRAWYKTQKAPFVTIGLILANIILFIAMCVSNIQALWNPGVDLLTKWGANWAPLTLSDQPWRIFTACFIHIGATHLLLNMVVLWLIGKICEPLFGHFRYLLIYLMAGAGGFLFSMLINPEATAAGASGAIMGLLGAHLSFIYTHKSEIGEEYFKRTLKALTVYLLMCTIYGATVNADHAGHFGGVFIGFLFGCVLTPVKQTHRRTAADLIMLALFFGAMVTFYFAESTGIADWSGKLLWMKANMLEEQNQYKRAIVLWETQLGRIGPNKVAYEGLARCYWKFGDYKNCLKNLNLTIEHGNDSLPIIQWRAELYLKFNDYQKAIDDESTVLKAKPNDRRARYARVCAYRSTNQFENALADCKVLLEQKVDFIGLYAAAYTNYEIGNYDEALRLCELSSKETNDQTSSILLKTGIYSKQRKFDEAWETLEKAREMKGVNEIAIAVDEAEIFMDQGEPQKCSSILQKHLSKRPTDPSLLYSLTIYYLTQKDYAKTIETASRVLKLPDDDPMRRSYMSIIYYLAACKAAPETKDTFISEHLRDPRISSLFVKHLMQFLLGQITEKELLTRAENKANQTEAHYYIGFKLQQAGKQAEANEHYQWVLDNGIKTFLEYRLAKRALATD